MKSKVYFIPVKESEDIDIVAGKLKYLLEQSKILQCVPAKAKVAVKMHFGEEGNTGFVKPRYLEVICREIARQGAAPFLADTNTLYRGQRTNSRDHLKLAAKHGFSREATGAEIVVPDDSRKENVTEIEIKRKFIKQASLARFFVESDALVAVTHFKGHIMTGFGGSLKNFGMGCATRVGKLMQHSDVSPVVYGEKCVGCGACEKVCPVKAITIINKKSVIEREKCIGCASCIAACPYSAIDVDWDSGESTIQERMIEYASAVLQGKKEKTVCFNFCLKITKECDCLAKDDPRIAPDVGILASLDPVSIDQASFDLINQACGRDIFKESHPRREGARQLEYAEELGIGSRDYELITLA